MNGYIKLHRKILNWQWFGIATVRDLFIYLLLRANIQDGYFKGHLIKRGQVFVGRQQLSKILGFTEQQIRTAIDKLKSTNEITTERTKDGTIITIVNWEDYQGNEQEDNQENNQQNNHLITIQQPTDNHLITTNKEEKEYKKNKKNNNKNIYDHFDWESKFEEFWIEYPKKVARQKCEDKFKKICTTEESFSAIMTGLRKYNELKYQFTDTQYIPNPLTWLNQQRWNDEVESNRYSKQNKNNNVSNDSVIKTVEPEYLSSFKEPTEEEHAEFVRWLNSDD